MTSYNGIGLIAKNSVAIPLVGVFADAKIIGKSSKVKITQKFKNTNKKAIEAIYRFPLPENATITGFTILLKNKTIKGVIEEKDKAFEIYDDALIKGNGAVLLDQERPNIFTLSVGNLNPGNEVSLEIEYISVLDFKNNILRFFLPTTISPRYVPEGMPDEDGIAVGDKIHPEYADEVSYGLNLKVEILKTKGMDLDSISSPSHNIKTSISDDCYLIEFTVEKIKMDRDFVVEAEYKSNNLNNAFYSKGQDESFVQVDFAPDLKTFSKNNSREFLPVKRDTIFVLDCSGSMQGSSITQAKKALEILIKALEPGQRFNIYRFGSNFDKFSSGLLEFGEEILGQAIDFLKNTDATFGGTEILAPLKNIILKKTKYVDYLNKNSNEDISEITNVVLITDGEVGNESEVINLVKSNKQYFRVFTVGIGYGPNEYFVSSMAKLTGGDYIFVHPGERIDLKIISLFKNLNMSAVENLKIDLGIDENLIEQAPERLAAFDNNNYSIYARIKKDFMPEKIVLKGIYNGQEIRWDLPVDEKINNDSGYISKFWAREKIRELEGGSFQMFGSQQKERKNKNIDNLIVELSKKYGVVSSKTSFISVEERSEEEKTKGEVELVKVPTLITYGWHRIKAYETSIKESITLRDIGAPLVKYFRVFDYLDENKTKRQLKDSILVDILSCQMPDGGFKISSNLFKSLKISKEDIERLAAKIAVAQPGMDLSEKIRLLSTALIVMILERYYKDVSNSWENLIKKSIHWYEQVLSKYNPEINKQTLRYFITAPNSDYAIDVIINNLDSII